MTEPTGTAAASISFAAQDGTLDGAMKYHAGYGSTDVTVESGEYQGYVLMNTKIAIAHINFTKDSQPYTGAVTMGGTGISNTLSVTPDGTFSGGGDGGITIGNGDGESGERYVTLIPTTETGVLNVAFTGDATGSMTFAKGIHENKFYGMSEAIAVTLEAAGPTHEYVDLGLSVKWAMCNVGADSPEKYGDYYAWGETETKDYYDWDTYKWCNDGDYHKLTKYNTKSDYGTVDNKTVLDLEDDAARANWGGDWRMPTKDEWQELYNNTTSEWTDDYNGTDVAGRVFTSKNNGNALFLPAAGNRDGTGVGGAGSGGYYWSSSLLSSSPGYAYDMYFSSGSVDPQGSSYRYNGFSVRPVQ